MPNDVDIDVDDDDWKKCAINAFVTMEINCDRLKPIKNDAQ